MAELKDWANPKPGDIVDDEFKFLKIMENGWLWRDLDEGLTFTSPKGIKNSDDLYDSFVAFQETPRAQGGAGRDLSAVSEVAKANSAKSFAEFEAELIFLPKD